ncbi:MAG: succinate dehydrogenase [Pseudomonadota bacterium]|nr:succinate dehydrogenase [Pseudomonadota bacterium]
MSPALFLAQRVTAVILAVAVTLHLATILYAAQHGITAGAILGRTRGNLAFLALYVAFVLAAAVHGPIGLRTILREWAGWAGRRVDLPLIAFALLVAMLGLRAAYGLYAA